MSKSTPEEQHKIAQRLRLAAEEGQRQRAQAEAAEWNATRDTDKARGVGAHDPKNAGVNFDQKIYWFPPHFLELRKELQEQWQDTLWPRVSWYMANQAEEFIERMNDWCGMKLPFDSAKVDWTCEQFLKKLRRMRGAA